MARSTVNRQERSARRQKQADAQAETIIADATARARRKKCPVCGAEGTAAELRGGRAWPRLRPERSYRPRGGGHLQGHA
jgi:hypothetical protein